MENKAEYSFLLDETTVHVMDVTYRRFDQAVPAHIHGEDAYEFHYVTEGRGTVVLKEMPYEVFPGILYVTGPGIVHEQIPARGGFLTEFGVYVQVSCAKSRKGTVLRALLDTSGFLGRGAAELSDLVSSLVREQTERQFGFEERVSHLLAEFLIVCARTYTNGPAQQRQEGQRGERQNPLARRVHSQLVMDEIFLYEYRDITLDALAGRLGFSVRQTQRWIRKIYGKSFQEKKLEARMSAAAMMLVNGEEKITGISERLGYSSIEHFSSAFSRYFGISPRSYRKQKVEAEKQN